MIQSGPITVNALQPMFNCKGNANEPGLVRPLWKTRLYYAQNDINRSGQQKD